MAFFFCCIYNSKQFTVFKQLTLLSAMLFEQVFVKKLVILYEKLFLPYVASQRVCLKAILKLAFRWPLPLESLILDVGLNRDYDAFFSIADYVNV